MLISEKDLLNGCSLELSNDNSNIKLEYNKFSRIYVISKNDVVIRAIMNYNTISNIWNNISKGYGFNNTHNEKN
jgi:hypothetical protein